MDLKLTAALFMMLSASGPVFADVDKPVAEGSGRSHALRYLWKNNALTNGEDIRLYDDGRYESHPWCDICGPRVINGSWHLSGNVLTLVADKGQARTRHTYLLERNDCHLLSPPEGLQSNGTINPLMAFTRDDERCDISPTGGVQKR